MYDYITGTISAATKDSVTMEANGIGYKICTTCACAAQAHVKSGERTKLYLSFVVRELSHTLFGFPAMHERDLFETLLNISGIGPKMALAMIGHIAPNELARAVAQKDITTLCKIPGIGKKTAERLLVELKNTLPSCEYEEQTTPAHPNGKDAVSALINLGYSQFTAQRAVKQAIEKNGAEKGLPQIIALALQETN